MARLLPLVKSLNHFTITFSHALTDVTATHIGAHLGRGLRTLVISNCSGFMATGLAAMASRCPNLQLLDLSHCAALPADTLIAIRKSLPKCTVLCDH